MGWVLSEGVRPSRVLAEAQGTTPKQSSAWTVAGRGVEGAPGRGGSEVGGSREKGQRQRSAGGAYGWLGPAGQEGAPWPSVPYRVYSNTGFPFADSSPAPVPPVSVPTLNTEETKSHSTALPFPPKSSRASGLPEEGNAFTAATGRTSPLA